MQCQYITSGKHAPARTRMPLTSDCLIVCVDVFVMRQYCLQYITSVQHLCFWQTVKPRKVTVVPNYDV